MASIFKDCPNVPSMSLRNELRGPRDNPTNSYKFMQQGASIIQASNPNVLFIISDLRHRYEILEFETSIVSLQQEDSLLTPLVWLHWYAFRVKWKEEFPNHLCSNITYSVKNHGGFLVI